MATRYSYTRASNGYDVFADGMWIGWSAGNRTDAQTIARDHARTQKEN